MPKSTEQHRRAKAHRRGTASKVARRRRAQRALEGGNVVEKRLKVSGYIDLPEGSELPGIGSKVFGNFVAEVDGDHRDRRKRRGGEVKIVRTAPATMTEESTLDRVAPPGPEDENQVSLEEDAEA